MAPIPPAVYATLLISDSYLPGAMVLGHSLRDHGAKAKLVALVTVDSLSGTTIDALKTIYDDVIPVSSITNKTPANLYLMDRPDLVSTFTKIELWRQVQYGKIVYIDADVVALRAPNELLSLESDFAAAPDIGWPDCFNSGVMVLRPNLGDYYSLLALAQRGISFDGADQGLLNTHFREWERISFTYNCTPSGNYQYVPAYRHFQSSISLVHFIGQEKPWVLGRYAKQNTGVYDELLGRWWAVYDKYYRPKTAQFSGQAVVSSIIQNYVKGEANVPYGYSSQTPTGAPTITVHPPQEAASEQPLADQPDVVESIQRGDYTPTSTVEQRRFSAPLAEWDASRAPPPSNAKPEAANFPSQVYTMSSEKTLFQPPAYPEPPKDMWYNVPNSPPKPEQVTPIFPWETRAPKPTRVFPPERPQVLPPVLPPEPEPEYTQAPSTTTDDTSLSESSISTPVKEIDSWQTYTRTNAWDEVPEISRYVAGIQRTKKGKPQSAYKKSDEPLLSPSVGARRQSLKLTDFPTEVERPSLPVTPAPIRRGSSFWGEERDAGGQLPAADGVPTQEDWVSNASTDRLPSLLPFANNPTWRCQYCGKQNPVVRLEDLQRRQSEVLEKAFTIALPEPPKRQMPESASKEAAEAADERAIAAAEEKPAKPTFTVPSYGSRPKASEGSKTKPKPGHSILKNTAY